MKKLIPLLLLSILVILIAVLLYHTLQSRSLQVLTTERNSFVVSDSSAVRLSSAVKIRTISYTEPEKFDSSAFINFHEFLYSSFPLVNSKLKKEVINRYSLLYIWQGKNSSLKPIILTAHMDVVPIEETSSGEWEHSPFSGEIENEVIWGRGTLDDKIGVNGIMEAVESLLKEGYEPERTIYIAFGHDEEIGGKNGAAQIADYLKSKQVQAEWLLDEGLVITEGIVPGVNQSVALIGTAEKGYLSIDLTVNMDGGHSSMPANENAITVLSEAIMRLQQYQMNASFCEPVNNFMSYVGPEMSFGMKMIFSNMWLFKPLVISMYEKNSSTNAVVRSTTAPTIFNSGVKDNVLPSEAKAVINFRILPGESSSDVLSHAVSVINDKRVTISISQLPTEPSAVSKTTTKGYKLIEKTIRQVFPNTIVAPSLMIAMTDSRHYKDLTENIYRFLPTRMNAEDLKRIHGINERIMVSNYKEVVGFYYNLIKNSK